MRVTAWMADMLIDIVCVYGCDLRSLVMMMMMVMIGVFDDWLLLNPCEAVVCMCVDAV